jgi:hypothetical protein
MQVGEPPVIKHAGEAVFPDVDFPLPIKLVAVLAFAWVLFFPILLGFNARRGELRRAVAVYAAGALAATMFFTVQSGLMEQSFADRVVVWTRHIWGPLLGVALVLSLTGVAIGRASRRFWPIRTR